MRASMLLATVLLAGCVKVTLQGHTIAEGRAPLRQPAETYREVTLAFAPDVRPQVTADAAFSADVLAETLDARLQAHGLIERKATRSVEVRVDDYSVRVTGAAEVLGEVPSVGSMTGLVRILDAQGREQRSIKVSTDGVFGVPKQGGREALKGLYRRFADRVVEVLAAPAT